MDELEQFEQFLADGYLLCGHVIRLSEYTSGSIDKAHSFFDMKIDRETLRDVTNKEK